MVVALSARYHAAGHAAPPSIATAPDTFTITTLGIATYYANDFDGRIMANGATFHMDDPTIAASNAWPLGTRLLVKRIPGGPWDQMLSPAERDTYFSRSVTVTVSDRGAFTHALDLSRGAFALLGRPEEGVIRVAIQPLDASPVTDSSR